MKTPDPKRLERLEELLVLQAMEGLESALEPELETLLTECAIDDPEGFERAAAALDLAFASRSGVAAEPLPRELAARIEADAARWLAESKPGRTEATPNGAPAAPTPAQAASRRSRWTLLAGTGWAAAAAAAVALFVVDGSAERRQGELRNRLAGLEARAEESAIALRSLNDELVQERGRALEATSALAAARATSDELEQALAAARVEGRKRRDDLNELLASAESRESELMGQLADLEELVYQPPAEVRLERLLARADDVVRVPWSATPDPLVEGSGVAGEVIWSDALQEGYMVFDAMRSNRELESQFQLWIFSANQSPETPVDGGVFDVGATARRLVVPIDPKLAVEDPSLFAVTLEKPGGVVVSSRDRLLLLAEV